MSHLILDICLIDKSAKISNPLLILSEHTMIAFSL